jgi:NitT/TauT family transport system permease protein
MNDRSPPSLIARVLPPLLAFIIFIFFWWLLKISLGFPSYILPSPVEVLSTFVEQFDHLIIACALTGGAALMGFLLSVALGYTLGLVFAMFHWLKRGVFPFAIFFQTVPIVAIAPLIILWVGHGFWGVVMVSLIISIFPIISGATIGLTQVPSEHLHLFRLYKASNWQILLKCQIPHSIPLVIANAKVSSGLCVIGAIVGEFSAGFGSNHFGLGYLILLTSGQLKTPYLFACIISSTLLGFAILSLAQGLSQWITHRFHLQSQQRDVS